jgi:DNA replication and repair protein RecF
LEIDRVELSDFRNYRTLSLTPAPHLNIFAGPNAQGKTNLLEGLGVLLVGRSFRGAKAADMLTWGAAGAFVGGEIRRGDTVRPIRRAVVQREDGRWGVGGEGCPWARAIAFGWPDLAILTEGPQARRNFIDGFAGKLYAAHLSGLGRYRQILTRRNHLLQAARGWGPADRAHAVERAAGAGRPELAGRRARPWRPSTAKCAGSIRRSREQAS